MCLYSKKFNLILTANIRSLYILFVVFIFSGCTINNSSRMEKEELIYKLNTKHKKNPNEICFIRHKKIDHKKSFKCKICKEKFTSKTSLKEHKFVHSSQRSFSCGRCKKGFFTQKKLKRHKKRCKKYDFVCLGCDKVFEMNCYLKKHTEYCLKLRSYECLICKKSSVAYGDLYKHLKSAFHKKKIIKENEYIIKCKNCNIKFRSKNSFQQHVVTGSHKKQHDLFITKSINEYISNISESENDLDMTRDGDNGTNIENYSKNYQNKNEGDQSLNENYTNPFLGMPKFDIDFHNNNQNNLNYLNTTGNNVISNFTSQTNFFNRPINLEPSVSINSNYNNNFSQELLSIILQGNLYSQQPNILIQNNNNFSIIQLLQSLNVLNKR